MNSGNTSSVVDVTKVQVEEFLQRYNHSDITRTFFELRKDEAIGNILDQVAEEASELIQAVIKFKRAAGLSAGTTANSEDALDDIIEEYADTVGCMEVLQRSLEHLGYLKSHRSVQVSIDHWKVYKRARALMRYYGYTTENAVVHGIRPIAISSIPYGCEGSTKLDMSSYEIDTAKKLVEFASRAENVAITEDEANVILSYMTGPHYFLWEDKSKRTLERIMVSGKTIIDIERYTLRDLITSCANANNDILSGKTIPNVANDTRNFEHDRDTINGMYTRIVLGGN